ncbi:MAG TPA: class IV adenylate cyclase [Vicinamibacterales bacterium]|nr:class IV adenylate cyclase [Vicinamibacterales bacterium]
MLEREIKLRFDSADFARQQVLSPEVGATPLRGRRLQEDCLLDTADNHLLHCRSALRLRSENGRSLLTFKGPVQPSAIKVREEHETVVADGEELLTILGELGLRVWFRYEKYREEFSAEDIVIAIDETPIGVFVEIEGSEDHIHRAAQALGRTSTDYVTASYRSLYLDHCRAQGVNPADMLF